MMAFRSSSDTGFECEFCLHENDPLFPCKQCIKSGGKKLLFTEKIPMPPVKPPKEETNRPLHIDVMVDIFGIEATKHFCLLNAFKCLWGVETEKSKEDVENAVWYLNEFIRLGGKDK
ncbi:MAG: DUF3310 domain-containing protein [Oscillospiraceae bacterium]|nr:DUF3310 domain-containing protein [Oscillospiraceae bacterium]